MNRVFRNKGPLAPFIMLSMIGHLLCGYLVGGVGDFNFSTPLAPAPVLCVTLEDPGSHSPQTGKSGKPAKAAELHSRPEVAEVEESSIDPAAVAVSKNEYLSPARESVDIPEPAPVTSTSITAPVSLEIPDAVSMEAAHEKGEKEETGTVSVPFSADYERETGPVRSADDFFAAKRERLTYRISLLKVPVGSAVMEADNNGGELRITLRITSNAVFSSVYPVDDLVETRMIKGNYLLTRVRQKEGSYRGDFGFTLMLREHKAFWVDRVTNRYDYQPLPGNDVMDLLSGFYFLRNRELKVGKKVLLNLFDSSEYSPTTVEVLRRERIDLPGSGEVDTLVLRPLLKTTGFFRRTGDIIIWLTDDQFRVPVRMETHITLGRVTAELVSAESEEARSVTGKALPGESPANAGMWN